MAEIRYLMGDATEPVGEGEKIITHCCNDIGAWGSGFVVAISKKWPEPEARFRQAYKDARGSQLGSVELVRVDEDIQVANIIGQRGVRSSDNPTPVRYDALLEGFKNLADYIEVWQKAGHTESVHMPRMGCGLAGGDWRIVEALIEVALIDRGIDVYVYDLPGWGQ